jgi:Leucine-rich repeat (LRR) protein
LNFFRNLIDDIKQVEFLNLCTNLENLTLYGNPICAKPTPEADDNVNFNTIIELL